MFGLKISGYSGVKVVGGVITISCILVGGYYLLHRFFSQDESTSSKAIMQTSDNVTTNSSTPSLVVGSGSKFMLTGSLKKYCSLCFEEITKENEILELDCFCTNCFDLSDNRLLKDLCTPIVIEKEGVDWLENVVIEPTRMERTFTFTDSPPPSSRIDSGSRSPSIKTGGSFSLMHKKGKLDRWLASEAILTAVSTFIGKKSIACSRVTLSQYIQGLLNKGLPIKIKQAYMPALLKLAMASRNFTYNIAPTGRLSKPSEEDMWVSMMVEVSYRAFLNRIRLLVMLDVSDDILDPTLKYIYLTHKTPKALSEKAYRFYIKRILFESGLGWPGFETREQAEEYKLGLPPNQEVIEIKNGNTDETVAWVVGERFKHHRQLIVRII